MIIDHGYLGYLKYDGISVEEGVMDARDSAEALLGFDKAFRHLINQEAPSWRDQNLNLPVRIEKGCWQILIPAGIGIFASYYFKETAIQAAREGFLETGAAKDLNRILKCALNGLKWVVRISNFVGMLGDKGIVEITSIHDVDHFKITDGNKQTLVVPRKYFDIYCNCPANLLDKCASIIDVGRELEIGTFDGEEIDCVQITNAEKSIFCHSKGEDDVIILPELTDGLSVELPGEITRATESENTIGFRYMGHVLLCYPDSGIIASFKNKMISKKEGHFFPKVKIIGVVNRKDKDDRFKAKKPTIRFSDIQKIEQEELTLFDINQSF